MSVPQRLISSAMGTGGLDFLIAYALLILCHSLFEIVIEQIAERGQVIFTLLRIYTVIDSNKVNLIFREDHFRIHAHLQVVTAKSRHISLCQLNTKFFTDAGGGCWPFF